ncbi:MAG: D-glycero-beta-D-manno-heptose-7-phosphate kinase [Pyrinomonadaceae bacterium]
MFETSRFSNARVLVIGDVMLDRYWWGSVTRISPEAPVPVVRLDRTSTAPGGAANVAVNISALGASTSLIGFVGKDEEADQLRNALAERSVAADKLMTIASRRTTVKTRIVAHNQHVVRIDSEDTWDISDGETEVLIEMIAEAIPVADVVVLSDYAKGTLSPSVLFRVINLSRELGKPILVDPKGKDFSKYKGASIITPNRREAAEACKLDEFRPRVVSEAGQALLDRYGFAAVLITEGENGMTLFESEDTFHVESTAHQVFDVTGAGDTVISALAVGLASGLKIRDAVELANTAAGIAVGNVGTAAVTVSMIHDVLVTSRGAGENQ